jgi:acyl-CoA synthetase (AMP-forming)/AMP-acid ligase II
MDATAAMQLTQPLHKALIERPEATALVCGKRRTRFGALADQVARLAAVLRAGHSLSTEDLVAHCRTQIAGYKCPRSAELPVPAAGMMLKHRLGALFWARRSRHVN